MAIYDRVEFDQLVPNEERYWDSSKLTKMISSIKTQGFVLHPIQVTEVIGKLDVYKVVDGMLRYKALAQLPYSHPARLSIPIEII